MEIQTTLNTNTLQAINKLWSHIDFQDNWQGNINKSIVQFTAAKFLKKQVSRMGKKPGKDFTISLQHFEAVIISTYLRAAALLYYSSTSLEHIQVNNYCNQLHQKVQ